MKKKEDSMDFTANFFERPQLDSKLQKLAEEELRETPERYKVELTQLQYLISRHPSIKGQHNEELLVRFLRAKKFDHSKAFHMLQRYYMTKLKCPELFKCPLPSEVNAVLEHQAQLILPNRDQHGRRIFVIRVDKFDSKALAIEDIFRTNILALEHAVREAETQISGIIVILDMAGLSLHHAKLFTPYYAKKTVEIVQETFPLRFKGFHVVNEPFYFDAIMAVIKPFLKEKMRKRIYLHGSNLSSLHAFINPTVLPMEYGGSAGLFDNRSWRMQLLAEEEYFRRLKEYGYQIDDNNGNS